MTAGAFGDLADGLGRRAPPQVGILFRAPGLAVVEHAVGALALGDDLAAEGDRGRLDPRRAEVDGEDRLGGHAFAANSASGSTSTR